MVENFLSDLNNDICVKLDYMEVGYYRVVLGLGIIVEMGVLEKVGIFCYIFLIGIDEDFNVLVDVFYVLFLYCG